MLTQQVSLGHRGRRAKAGSEAEYNQLSHTIRWLWRRMQQARASKKRVDPLNPHCDWTRGYWSGVATATKISLRDSIRIRRAIGERVRS